MLFEDEEINSAMQEELNEFFKPSPNGQSADFIIRQPDNPNAAESIRIKPKSLDEEQASALLLEARQQVWG